VNRTRSRGLACHALVLGLPNVISRLLPCHCGLRQRLNAEDVRRTYDFVTTPSHSYDLLYSIPRPGPREGETTTTVILSVDMHGVNARAAGC